MRVLIYGRAGFIAKHLAPILTSRRCDVCCLGTRDYNVSTVGAEDVFRSSYLELETCLRSFRPDVVIHLSSFCLRDPSHASLSLAKSRDRSLISAIQSIDCSCKLIFVGSMACFPANGRMLKPNQRAPVTHYGAEKAFMAELIEQHASLPSIVLYPSSIYGPGQVGRMLIPSLLASIKNKSILDASGSAKVRDYIYVKDFCNFVVDLVYDEGDKKEEIFVQSGSRLSLGEVSQAVAKACNVEAASFVAFRDSPLDRDDYQTTAASYTRFITYPTKFAEGIARCATQSK